MKRLKQSLTMKNTKEMRIRSRYIIVVACVLVMTACRVKQQYSITDLDLPDEFHLPDSVSQNLDSTLIPWQEFFKDTVLNNLIDQGFEHNFELRIADKEIDINNAYYKQSKLNFLPSLNLNIFEIEREWNSHNSSSGAETDWYDHEGKTPPEDFYISTNNVKSSAILDWEIGLWGKFRNQKRAAEALYQESNVARRLLQTELVATIAEDYYSLLMLDEQLDVAKRNHRFRDSTLQMIKLLYTAGDVTALAVQQSQTQVLEASTLISELEEQIAIQQNNLRLIIGKLPGDIHRGVNLMANDSMYNTVNELPLYLVQNRPDVLMSRYELTAANANVGVAQANRFPNLTISIEGGVESVLPQNWFDIPGSLLGGIVGGLTAPIFNGGKLTTAYKVAKLKRDQAEINFQRNVYTAIVDIRNTLVSLDKLEEQLDIATVKQMVAEKALNNSRMLFRAGYATYLEVITAQSEAMDIELNLVRTKAKLLTEQVQLYRALGGGWEE